MWNWDYEEEGTNIRDGVKVIKAVRELTGWDSRRQKPLQMLHLMCYMRSETRLRLCIIYALSCRIFPNRRSG